MTWLWIVLAFVGGVIFGFIIAVILAAGKIADLMALLEKTRGVTDGK